MKKFLLPIALIIGIVVNAQNVGIGTNNPQTKLQVEGSISSTPVSAAAAAAVVIPNNTSVFHLTAVAGSQANVLTMATPAEGQYLYIYNADDDIATFAGQSIAATNGVASFNYIGTNWRVVSNTKAGGDLSGNYPNPVVDKIQGKGVSAVAPNNGDVLKYNTTTQKYEPSPDLNSGGTVGTVTASPPLNSTGGSNPNISLTGTVPVGNGGTGLTAVGAGQILIGTSSNTFLNTNLTGTANQVNINSTSGNVTLSTPQDIATTSSPTFTKITATGANINSVDATGSIKPGTTSATAATAGTGSIRTNGTNLEYSDGTNWKTLSSGGTVTNVTGTAPIVSSGGAAPAISITAATGSASGSMSAADKAKLDAATSANTANTIVTRDGAGNFAAGTITANLNGNATTATTAGSVTNTNGQLLRTDIRTIAPSSINAGYAQFGFTSFTNNNSGPYADFLHLRSYTDASGGNDNLVLFNKSTIGMRLYQQAWGSATPYATFKDVAFTDGTNAAGTWGINISGNAATATTATTAGSASSVAYSAVTGIPTRSNWVGVHRNFVAEQLSWKNYNNGHTIFDASAGTSPDGTAVNNTTAQVPWTGTYPTLMGWNGVNTYGVRVDAARLADNATTVGGLSAGSFMQYQGFTLDANTMTANRSGFTYSVNAPFTGPIVHFDASNYGLQINSAYSASGIGYRTRNGDNGTWNPWREFITTANIGSYADNLGNHTATTTLNLAGNTINNAVTINPNGDHFELMTNKTDDNVYEWMGFYSGGSRQALFLWDGAWTGANNVTNEFSLTAENSNILTLNGSNHIALMPKSSNVGIGILAPVGRLDIQGTVTRSGTTPSAQTLYVTGSMQPGTSGPGSGNVEFRHDNQTQGIGFGYQTIYAASNNPTQPVNILSKGSDPITLNAYSYGTGNVGIGAGITAPTRKLEVNGDIKLSPGYQLYFGESVTTSSKIGINFHTDGDPNYGIYKPAGAWTQPLHIGFYTGVKIGAASGYGGTKFYNSSDMGTEIMSVGNGDNHVRIGGYMLSQYVNTTDNAISSGVTGIMAKQGDNYYRTADAAAVRNFTSNRVYASTTTASAVLTTQYLGVLATPDMNVTTGDLIAIDMIVSLRNTNGSGNDRWALSSQVNGACGAAVISTTITGIPNSNHNGTYQYAFRELWVATCSGVVSFQVNAQRFDSDDTWQWTGARVMATKQ